jgi:hypothetical protein
LLVRSSIRGARENVLFVLGAAMYRCELCEMRYAYFRKLAFPLRRNTDDATAKIIAFALSGGVLVCFAIALWTLRRFHRWPF